MHGGIPLMLALRKLRQEIHEYKVSLGYVGRSVYQIKKAGCRSAVHNSSSVRGALVSLSSARQQQTKTRGKERHEIWSYLSFNPVSVCLPH